MLPIQTWKIFFFLSAIVCCGFFSISAVLVLDAIVTPSDMMPSVSRSAVVIGVCLAIDFFSGSTFWRTLSHIKKNKQFTSISDEMPQIASSYNQLTITVIVIAALAVASVIFLIMEFFRLACLLLLLF